MNPLHYDEAAAKGSRFGEILVQGSVTSAILNAVVAERLPGPGTMFLSTNLDFKAPVRPGDAIAGRVEVISVRADKPITTVKTTVARDEGTVVLDGTAVLPEAPRLANETEGKVWQLLVHRLLRARETIGCYRT